MTGMVIDTNKKLSRISKEIYGHFSEHLGRCIYGGIYVGKDSPIENVNGMRSDVVEALKQIRVPVLRWPGGCFADEYHWKDGIGSADTRKKIINTNWGGVVEDNSFGTHEYFELCRQLGCETYINGNLGSGTIKEMAEWVEYMTFDGVSPMAELRKKNGSCAPWKVDFFGLGNENWGCGGNMNPDYYANEYRRYQTFIRDYNSERHIKKICCGAPHDDYEWTKEVLETCFRRVAKEQHGFMDGLSLHYYVYPEGIDTKGSSTDFDQKVWYKTLNKAVFMDELITKHGEIMDEYDPDKKIGMIVDEWGTWYTCEPGTNPGFLYQQNTMRDALVAGITLNIFNKHSDRVKMANLAQIVNVLQAVILTEGDKIVKTPTYHVFDIYKYHQDAELIFSDIDIKMIGVENEWQVPNLTESVSITSDGVLHLTMTNLSAEESFDIDAEIIGKKPEKVLGEIVTGEIHAKNTFDEPECVVVRKYDGAQITEKGIRFIIPASSVLHLELR
ncbi:MAG: alpha-L-arabinofuranosidase C-terminal domain-containing protein [Eubacteriales bacterium]|nr:alpha-L-arabinofuranosidase C-terminal domain-containing protein [Eubacteriales bacterium]